MDNRRKTIEEFVKKRVTKADLLLTGLLLAAGMGGLLFFHGLNGRKGTLVRITADGREYGTYPLSVDQTIHVRIDGTVTNTLRISDGTAKMIQADCPDQLCVHQNAVSGRGSNIVCLTNKIVVEVTGETETETDSVSR